MVVEGVGGVGSVGGEGEGVGVAGEKCQPPWLDNHEQF